MTEENGKEKTDRLQELINLRSRILDDMESSRKLLSEIESEIAAENPVSVARIVREQPRHINVDLDNISTGIQRLDELMSGGYPEASNVMLSGPPYSSKYMIADHFIVNSLASGYPVIVVSLDRDVRSLRYDISRLDTPVEAYEDRGLLKFVDAYSKNIQMDSDSRNATVIDSAANISLFLKTMDNICGSFVAKYGRYRMVLFSLTGWITQSGDEKTFPKALQHFTQRRKLEGATTLYLIEDGIFEKSLYENMNYFMDGSVEFRSETSTEYLRVRGLKKIKSRDWIEVINNGGNISLGSFELKRIK